MKSPKKMPLVASLPCGVYRHYKGEHYLVLGVAKHSETEAAFVVYVRLYARGGCPLWIRPLKKFTQMVRGAKGRRVKRFMFVGLEQPGGG
jgi:cyclomaltodextrinase / maltogenic alpha-amylase / neopullulanase